MFLSGYSVDVWWLSYLQRSFPLRPHYLIDALGVNHIRYVDLKFITESKSRDIVKNDFSLSVCPCVLVTIYKIDNKSGN